MRKFFGTDGIRGVANQFPLVPDQLTRIAQAVGVYFRAQNRKSSVIIGKDTRLSGYLLEHALTAGFVSVGMDVILVGPLPTPAISMLSSSMRADLGVVISASHNPYHDNGIKFFGPDGYKLSDDMEKKIEKRIQDFDASLLGTDFEIGQARRLDGAGERYIEYVKNTIPRGLRFNGLRLVIDCAHGATYKIAPHIFWELGAETIVIGNEPNGYNINENVGATHPQTLIQEVKKYKADLGIAFDGDGDRLTLVDEKGHIIDGDNILAVLALYMKKSGLLKEKTVVSTVMANLGLEEYLHENDIRLERTAVGDRHVVTKMRELGANLGGEQSGHILMTDHIPTGDGLITAIQFVDLLVETGQKASAVGHPFKKVPQLLKNVKVSDAKSILSHPDIIKMESDVEKKLKGKGRLLLRKSGTEPLIRVMLEGSDLKELENLMVTIEEKIKQL